MSSFYDRFNWITVAQDLSASEKTLSFALLKHLNAQGTCWPSKKLLAEETGLSTRHIRRLIISLVEKGVLECTPRTLNRTTSNLYKFRFPSKTEPKDNGQKTDLAPSPLPERSISYGQNVTRGNDTVSPGSGHGDTCGVGRMSPVSGQDVSCGVDRMSPVGGQDVTGGMTRCHPELKELELEKLELEELEPEKRNLKGEGGNRNCSFTPLHVQFPRRPSRNTLPATQRAAASPPQIIPEVVSNPRHPKSLSTLPEKILELYGRLCPDLPPAGGLTANRTRAVLRIVKEFPSSQSLEWWENYFDRAAKSSFLAGGGPKSWKADLDWLLVPKNAQKVLDGNYDDTHPTPPRSAEEKLEQYVDRMVAELQYYCLDDT